MRSSGTPRRLVLSALLLLAAGLGAGEPLICRGHDAATAALAISGSGGGVLVLDAGLSGDRSRPVWFALAGTAPDAGRQALAHALGCWWTGGGWLTRSRTLVPDRLTVRVHPPLARTPPGLDGLLASLMAPWLASDGGLARDPSSGAWTATTTADGQTRLETLLSALGDPHPRAPHLLPGPGEPPEDRRLDPTPSGADLGAWAIAVARGGAVAVALGPDVDPATPAPGPATTLAEAVAALRAAGLGAAVHHGCLCISRGPISDLRHPAERAVVAILPVGHLCPDQAAVESLATRIAARVRPGDWKLPGWGLAALPWRAALLVMADPVAIHAVMAALEAEERQTQP